MPEESGELLIASPERWDEACFAAPAVRALLRSGWKIAVLCHSHQQVFWESIPGLQILSSETRESARSLAKRITGQWRSAIVWEDSELSRAIRKAKIDRSIGPKGEKWAKWTSDPIDLTPHPKKHRVEYFLTTARSLGQNTRDASLFSSHFEPASDDRILLVPDSDYGPAYEWPLDQWKQITARLRDLGRSYQIASHSYGRNLGKNLAEELDARDAIDVPLSATALETFAEYSIVIAADGSVPHLASHAGSTCLTLFGPGDPALRRPLGTRHRIARQHVECAPCSLPNCVMDHRCQNELQADRVWHEIARLLGIQIGPASSQ